MISNFLHGLIVMDSMGVSCQEGSPLLDGKVITDVGASVSDDGSSVVSLVEVTIVSEDVGIVSEDEETVPEGAVSEGSAFLQETADIRKEQAITRATHFFIEYLQQDPIPDLIIRLFKYPNLLFAYFVRIKNNT